MLEGIKPMRDAYTDVTRKGASPVDGGPISKKDLYPDDYGQIAFERAKGPGVGEPVDDQDPLAILIEQEENLGGDVPKGIFKEATPRTIDDVLSDIESMEVRQRMGVVDEGIVGISSNDQVGLRKGAGTIKIHGGDYAGFPGDVNDKRKFLSGPRGKSQRGKK